MNSMEKKDLKGLTLGELESFAVSIGENKYRGKQLFEWLYAKEVSAFSEMSSISKSLREKLSSLAAIHSLALVEARESQDDGTTKFLLELSDGKRIECVLIPPRTAFQDTEAKSEEEQKRLTLCVSTQVGCPLDCQFCATAMMGFVRNLTAGEIIDQVLQVKKISGRQITNLVYMGMGEPLMNYDNVMKSVDIITNSMGIAARRVTISTAGWVPGIRRMADENRKVKLAISLHTLDERIRQKIMPITRKFSLRELLESIQYYYRKVRQRVTFEYILFAGLNDSDEDIARLIRLSKMIPSKVNIIPFHSIGSTNPDSASKLRPTQSLRAEEFVAKLREGYVTTFVRSSAGSDVNAACGQLAVKAGKNRSTKNPPSARQSKTSSVRPA